MSSFASVVLEICCVDFQKTSFLFSFPLSYVAEASLEFLSLPASGSPVAR